MKTCKEIHPGSKVNISFTCCRERYKEFVEVCSTWSIEGLLFALSALTKKYGRSPEFQDKKLYNFERVCEFEAYGRASETFDVPWVAWISPEFSGDREYRHKCEGMWEAVAWLLFHLYVLKDESW